MEDKRRAKRLKDESEVTITIVAGGKRYPKGKVIYNTSKDISASGTKIQSNIFLPIDTLLKIDFKLKNIQQMISAMGKVKWIKIICEDESYDAGVEFVNTPKEAIQKIADYIAWKQKPTNPKPYII
jgi:c-di-GMP-binding flagellar brake protein YcgR